MREKGQDCVYQQFTLHPSPSSTSASPVPVIPEGQCSLFSPGAELDLPIATSTKTKFSLLKETDEPS